MAGFWDRMSEGFTQGVPLGVRTAERAQDQAREDERIAKHDAYLGRQEDRAGAQLELDRSREARAALQSEREAESHRHNIRLGKKQEEAVDLELERKKDEKRRKDFQVGIGSSIGLAKVGLERDAIYKAADTYRNNANNGDDLLVFWKDDKPDMKLPDGKTWKDFPEDTKYLVVSQQFGVNPFKSAQAFLDVLEPYATDPGKLIEYERNIRKTDEEWDAQQKSFIGKDGKPYIKKRVRTANRVEYKDVPYTGQEAMAPTEEKINTVNDLVQRGKLTKEEGRVLLGVSKAESPSERIKARYAGQDERLKFAKGLAELDGKQRDKFKKDLDLALRPFMSEGQSATGVSGETDAGRNALTAAAMLIEKAEKIMTMPDEERAKKRGKSKLPNAELGLELTETERRNLPFARRALDIYERISGTVAADYGTTRARDPKGNIWEVDEAGNPVRMVEPATKDEAPPAAIVPPPPAPGAPTAPPALGAGLPAPQAAGLPAAGLKPPARTPGSTRVQDGRIPGYSPNKWNAMSEEEKTAARAEYRKSRKEEYYRKMQ
jgi:hypothetical protein